MVSNAHNSNSPLSWVKTSSFLKDSKTFPPSNFPTPSQLCKFVLWLCCLWIFVNTCVFLSFTYERKANFGWQTMHGVYIEITRAKSEEYHSESLLATILACVPYEKNSQAKMILTTKWNIPLEYLTTAGARHIADCLLELSPTSELMKLKTGVQDMSKDMYLGSRSFRTYVFNIISESNYLDMPTFNTNRNGKLLHQNPDSKSVNFWESLLLWPFPGHYLIFFFVI